VASEGSLCTRGSWSLKLGAVLLGGFGWRSAAEIESHGRQSGPLDSSMLQWLSRTGVFQVLREARQAWI